MLQRVGKRILFHRWLFLQLCAYKHRNRGIGMSNIRLKIHFVIESYWVNMVSKKRKQMRLAIKLFTVIKFKGLITSLFYDLTKHKQT